MKRTPKAIALRTRCAERTRAMQPIQLVCRCVLYAYAQVCAKTCALFSQNVCIRDDRGHKCNKKTIATILRIYTLTDRDRERRRV